jgi:uncharacterized protein YecE (DUF72 family)
MTKPTPTKPTPTKPTPTKPTPTEPTTGPTSPIRVGCSQWDIPAGYAASFAGGESHLERYASRFNAVEITSSFQKQHRRRAYATWASVVPADFRFAVKLPKHITHSSRLADYSAIGYFLPDVAGLGDKLAVLLVQLPPSLAYGQEVCTTFFTVLRERFAGGIVCEPRHASWFSPEVDDTLAACRVARAAADPASSPQAAEPGGWSGLVYYRLHGAPRIYYSSYGDDYLAALAEKLRAQARSAEVWCVFDNTAVGAAAGNALALTAMLRDA